MANEEHLNMLFQGVDVWNKWRKDNPDIMPDLIGASLIGTDLKEANFYRADLNGADLSGADLRWADLSEAELNGAYLSEANLCASYLIGANIIGADVRGAHLIGASLIGADLYKTYLNGANLSRADLSTANLSRADLSWANLGGSDLKSTIMVETCLCGTDLTGSCVYGISAWNIKSDENTKQNSLAINKADESTITVDNLEVAQFIYLMLNSKKIRDVINTMTSKVVLILGRFTDDRIKVLNAIREELRKYNYTPIMFDFVKPDDRSFIETVSTLAHMARFVIADFTDPKIVLQEAQHIVPNIVIPFAPIFLKDSGFEPITLYDLRKGRTTVLDTFCYDDCDHLLDNLSDMIIKPAENLARSLNMENPIK